MPAAVILNNTGATTLPLLVQQIRQGMRQINAGANSLSLIYAQLNAMVDNTQSPPSYAQVEQVLGLESGQGATIVSLFANANALLTNPAFEAFVGQIV